MGHASSMSSARPAAFWSAMSITTTSASCFSAMPRATVAPTLPAPPTTVTLRFIRRSSFYDCSLCVLCFRALPSVSLSLHILDDVVPELRCLQLRRAVHQAREVVRHALGGDRAFHALDDQVRHFAPPKMTEHHLAGEQHRSRVHLVLVR